jgi:hypothetical protein
MFFRKKSNYSFLSDAAIKLFSTDMHPFSALYLHCKLAITYSEDFDSTSKWRQERSKLYNL